MGEALLAGWIAAGHEPADLLVVEADQERAAALVQRHGVRIVDYAQAASAETVILAVKPHQILAALRQIGPSLPDPTLVVSIAAGVTCARVAASLQPGQPVVRVMPNTPALVGQGMAGVCGGPSATPEHLARVVDLMSAVGRAIEVSESAMDALTALSGSGPAYLFYVADAMIEAGVHQGLSRAQARELVAQTIVGAGAMLAGSDRSAAELREQVTSPAGTTAAALRVLEDRGVRAGFLGAIQACAERSAELGQA
ncbi:MAG: pyrroline-5-carboxylate reductase [Arachnia sp.]